MAVTSKNLRTKQERSWSEQQVIRVPRHISGQTQRPTMHHVQQQAKPVINMLIWIVFLVTLSLVIGLLNGWLNTFIDDIRYGRPRVSYHTAFVGHEADQQHASEFMAINLNRRVVVLQFPGGDATQSRTIVGPYLFGANEDLTPVTLNTQDVNGDGAADLLVNIKNEQLVYINDQNSFRVITAGEQQLLDPPAP